MPIRSVSANRSFNRAAPSNIEYSVCTCRCANESPTPAPLVIARADGQPRAVASSLAPPTDKVRERHDGATRMAHLTREALQHHADRTQPGPFGGRREHAVLDVRAAL